MIAPDPHDPRPGQVAPLVADDVTCRAYRILWGMRIMDAINARDIDGLCDAMAVRGEWEG